jgi:sugar phosphate isomerase/epimerase
MKAGLVICGPDVEYGPLALLSGTFEEKCSKAARLGFHGVELMVRDPASWDWDAVEGCLREAQLEVPQIVTGEVFGADGLCLVTADQQVRRRAQDRARAVIDLGARLNAIVNIGRLRGQLKFLGPLAEPMASALDALRGVIEYAADRGVRIAIEPLNRYETDFIFSADDGMRLLDGLGYGNVGLMLDTFHMNIEDASIPGGFRLAAERVWHVHIADSNRLHPGAGHIDFDSVFEALEQIDYTGYVSGEMLPLPDPDTAAERTAAFLHSRGVIRSAPAALAIA